MREGRGYAAQVREKAQVSPGRRAAPDRAGKTRPPRRCAAAALQHALPAGLVPPVMWYRKTEMVVREKA